MHDKDGDPDLPELLATSLLHLMAATCALCGATNPVSRVYRGMFASKPNLVAISCRECGEVSSQLRTLPEFVAFALIYSSITLLLLMIGMGLFGHRMTIVTIATIAAVIPWTFMPAWWSSRQAAVLAEGAPAPDLPAGRKAVYLVIAILVIAVVIGVGTFVYLMATT